MLWSHETNRLCPVDTTALTSGLLDNDLFELLLLCTQIRCRRCSAICQLLKASGPVGNLLKDRVFEFAVERTVFVATLHRIFVSGSDRDCASWMEDYDIFDT